MRLPRTVRAGRDVVFRELGGEMVLLDLKSGVYYGLNEIGARMWSLLVELRDPGQVVDALERQYAADRPQLVRDLEKLVAALSEKGLLDVEEA